MRTIHDAAREVLYAEKLPALAYGLCNLFSRAPYVIDDAYEKMSKFNGGEHGRIEGYVSPEGQWDDARIMLLLLLAETDPADFEPDAVSEVETLMLHGMTEHDARLAASNRLLGTNGPYYPERGSLSEWLLWAFTWEEVRWNDLHDRLAAQDSRTYVSINRP